MPIGVACKCGWNLQVNDDLAGKQINCPICDGRVFVPLLTQGATSDVNPPAIPSSNDSPISPSEPRDFALEYGVTKEIVEAAKEKQGTPTNHALGAFVVGSILILLGFLASATSQTFIYFGAVLVGVTSISNGFYCLFGRVRIGELPVIWHVVSGFIGFVVSMFFMFIMMGKSNPQNTPVETVQVVAAASDLRRGLKLTNDMLQLKAVPRDLVPNGAIFNLEGAVGRFTVQGIAKDELILEAWLDSNPVHPVPPPGKRAYTMPFPPRMAQLAFLAFLRPGDKVDVHLVNDNVDPGEKVNPGDRPPVPPVRTIRGVQNPVPKAADPKAADAATMLLSDVEILAVDSERSVTLLVTPQQAAILDVAMQRGKLILSLPPERKE